MKVEDVISETIKIVRNVLPADYKILLFGSWAKDNALETSDIDIGILGERKAPWDKMARILDAKDNIPTLRSIDIVDLRAKEENFRNNVLKHAKFLA